MTPTIPAPPMPARPITPRPLWERHQLFREPDFPEGLDPLEDEGEDPEDG
jgi:hypothetical protein